MIHHQQGYELDDRPYHDQGHQQPLDIPMGPGPQIQYLSPGDRMQVQPTYSVENLQHSFGHNEAFNDEHPFLDSNGYPERGLANGNQQYPNGDVAFDPQAHHDQYHNDPYQPQGAQTPEYGYGNEEPHYWQDDADDQPILQARDTAYGPDPHSDPSPTLVDQPANGYTDATPQKPKNPAPIRRWKTVKEVQLYNGNLVLDCPIPPRLLNQITHAPPPERDEFTHMRYSAATCDPADFYNERFTLRQKLFAKPRNTELFIVVTMYNEEEELFARTMMGVIENIKYMNQRSRSKTWGKEAWKKIVVCVVSDGRAKINPRTRAVLAAMGCYQEGIAKQQVNGKDVTAHIYEVCGRFIRILAMTNLVIVHHSNGNRHQ
jgi:chitin synthase